MISEHGEQIAFRQWLDLHEIPYFRVPNETYTKSWNQKRLNKALGVKPGIPDMFVLVYSRVIAIEMKRQKGGKLSPNQKYWLELLPQYGVDTYVCNGADEAIAVVNKYTKILT